MTRRSLGREDKSWQRPLLLKATDSHTIATSTAGNPPTEANVLWDCNENEERHSRFTSAAASDQPRIQEGPSTVHILFPDSNGIAIRDVETELYAANAEKKRSFTARSLDRQPRGQGGTLHQGLVKRHERGNRPAHLNANKYGEKRRWWRKKKNGHKSTRLLGKPKKAGAAFNKIRNEHAAAPTDWLASDISGEPDKIEAQHSGQKKLSYEPVNKKTRPPNIIEDDIATDLEEASICSTFQKVGCD